MDDLGESIEEVSARGGELVTADEPTVVPKLLLDAIVVKDSQGDGCFSNSSWTDESEWSEVFCETNDLLIQFVAPKAGPWWWRRWLSRYAGCKYEVLDSL